MKLQIIALFLLAQVAQAEPNLIGKTDRPLRYHPAGTDFVIENGPEKFNRPLYINNSAMRVDAGDRPEFSLFLPGRGGNLRLGVRIGEHAKWLDDAEKIVARYRPAEMLYEISDPMLGNGTVTIDLLTLAKNDGYIARIEGRNLPGNAEAVFAFGGVDGEKGRRNGDIGCEPVPVSQFFAFKPERCVNDDYICREDRFYLVSKSVRLLGRIQEGTRQDDYIDASGRYAPLKAPTEGNKTLQVMGIVPEQTTLKCGAANQWNDAGKLLESTSHEPPAGDRRTPVVVGWRKLDPTKPTDIIIQKQGEEATLAGAYDDALLRAKSLREKVVIDTPDPFINAAAAAINAAADGVWDEKLGAVMHGAVAWRVKLLGWRGPYANDALGWHDRAERHLRYWAGQQNTSPVPTTQPGADESANLSRCEAALHSNGDISHSHYDMNLVYIDALFRHLMWTGDLKMARDLWRVIQRHIAWERRLFRREYGPDKLPLYEGYCCIWASDDVYYSGGGATHATAYNYWHNRMAAKIARAIGEDPAPYDHEADLIWKAMQKLLWVDQTGCFAEYKDWLGLQLVHPAAAVWTIYHAIDSQACTPEQALSMTNYIDREIAQIPIRGPGVPDENLYTIPTTNWMPYTWSTNNVVMAEAAHTSLAYWQAGRNDDAFRLFKGTILNSMYMGLCPGNCGMCTQFDMARGESQRDFADAVGVCSRTVVEGLFGVRPDLISGEVVLTPGFPSCWDHASIQHPDFKLEFVSSRGVASYIFTNHFQKKLKVRLLLPGEKIDQVQESAPDQSVTFRVADNRLAVKLVRDSGTVTIDKSTQLDLKGVQFEPVDLDAIFNDRVTEIFKHDYVSPRSPFCSLSLPKQGMGTWCHPDTTFEVDDSGLRRVASENVPAPEQPAASGGAKRGSGIILPDGRPLRTPGSADANVAFVSRWDNFPHEIEIALTGTSPFATLMLAGTTNSMQSQFDNGEVIATYADGTTDRLALRNPTNWWPIDQDYYIDDYAFKDDAPPPIRVDLATGKIRTPDRQSVRGTGGKIRGGSATVITMPLDPSKPLKSLTVRALANDVVIGLMSLTLARNETHHS
jgi:hypothetical protein